MSALMLTACGAAAEPEAADAPENTPTPTSRRTWQAPADPCAVLPATTRRRLDLQDGQAEKNRCMWLSSPDRMVTQGELRVLDVRFRPNSGVDGAKIVYREMSRMAFATGKPTQKVLLKADQLDRIGAKQRGSDYDAAYWTFSAVTEKGLPTGLGEIGLRKDNLVVQIVLAGNDRQGAGPTGARRPISVDEFTKTMELLVAGVIDTVREA